IPGSNEAFYIPEFVTHSEEEYLIRKINEPQQKWKQLVNRRSLYGSAVILILTGGELTAKNTLVPQAIPAYLIASPDGGPNHVILNKPGQRIMLWKWALFSLTNAYHPVVTPISVGSHAVFHYFQYKKIQSESPETPDGRVIDTKPRLSALLQPRNAIITAGALYVSHLHAGSLSTYLGFGTEIANWNLFSSDTMKDLMRQWETLKRETRYSLTCRDVAKVFKEPF
ncbi:hypothetical protein C8J56DRAFT_980491, partial [Mycena floridula]